MAKARLLVLWLFINFPTLKGVSLPEGTADRISVCSGDEIRASCTAGKVIAVQDVSYGTKLSSTCGQFDTSAGCCDYNSGDCFLPAYTDTTQQRACSGKNLCTDMTVAQADTSSCGGSYPNLNHYLSMKYHCIDGARIAPMCLSSTQMESTGSSLYLWNQDYPNKMRATDTSCSCSVEVSSCSSQINVYLLHLDLSDGGGSCAGTQQIQVDDNGSVQTWSCSDNNDYEITLKLTSSSNYIKVTMENPDGIDGGYFWIGFKETSGSFPLHVNCPAVDRTMCMDCPGLSHPVNGHVAPTTSVSTGQTATYTCNMGFNIIGGATRTCQSDGTWSGSEPVCGKCHALSPPNNGAVSASGAAGETVTYTCNSGYELEGSATRNCQADNTWAGTEPTCTATETGDNDGGGLSGGAIAGIVIGIIAGIVLGLIIAGVIYKRPCRNTVGRTPKVDGSDTKTTKSGDPDKTKLREEQGIETAPNDTHLNSSSHSQLTLPKDLSSGEVNIDNVHQFLPSRPLRTGRTHPGDLETLHQIPTTQGSLGKH